jgi:hypothetical protein
LTRALEDADVWRGPLAPALPSSGFKEWQHFLLFGPGWVLVFNLNLDGTQRGRVISLLHHETWHGDVSACRAPNLHPGRLDATFGDAGMRFRGGRYEIWRDKGDLKFEASLTPVAAPSLSHGIRLGKGSDLSWCLVPRLLATGWLEHGERRYPFADCLAYHDHNWGHFGWGGDFSWDWACVVPDDAACPWTVVLSRMNDRARHRTTATSVFVLKDGAHLRYFRDAEAQLEMTGNLGRAPELRVPPAAGFLVPDCDHDVPKWTKFRAARGDDYVTGTLESMSRSQVLVPSDGEPFTIARLNEAHARAAIEGRCAGLDISLEGPALLEVLRG